MFYHWNELETVYLFNLEHLMLTLSVEHLLYLIRHCEWLTQYLWPLPCSQNWFIWRGNIPSSTQLALHIHRPVDSINCRSKILEERQFPESCKEQNLSFPRVDHYTEFMEKKWGRSTTCCNFLHFLLPDLPFGAWFVSGVISFGCMSLGSWWLHLHWTCTDFVIIPYLYLYCT